MLYQRSPLCSAFWVVFHPVDGSEAWYQVSAFLSAWACKSLTPVSYTHLDVYKRQISDKMTNPLSSIFTGLAGIFILIHLQNSGYTTLFISSQYIIWQKSHIRLFLRFITGNYQKIFMYFPIISWINSVNIFIS